LNWPLQYQDRLRAWLDLREHCQSLDLASVTAAIDQWWQRTPWRPYYLHWDDREDWPNPWQLLADNEYCDVARALGIMYTVKLLERADCADAVMVSTDQGNLVLVQGGKYVMNWNSDEIVNIQSTQIKIQRTLESSVLDRLLG
jgi:hypothetical protein